MVKVKNKEGELIEFEQALIDILSEINSSLDYISEVLETNNSKLEELKGIIKKD